MEHYHQWVEDLGVKHRAKLAQRSLMAAGPLASTALREGLHHPDPTVRIGCCVVLDHHLDAEAIPELIANLSHPHEKVRAWAMHALACDRCKEGTCRPGENEVIPLAAKMLVEDESRWVRQMAAGVLGPSVLRHPAVLPALQYAFTNDPHPVVRKIASWYIPGGPIHKRLIKIALAQPTGRLI